MIPQEALDADRPGCHLEKFFHGITQKFGDGSGRALELVIPALRDPETLKPEPGVEFHFEGGIAGVRANAGARNWQWRWGAGQTGPVSGHN